MIEPWVAQELRQIERQLKAEDPRFAAGLRYGSPCPPREYRRRRAFLLLLAGTAAALVCGLVAGLAATVPLAVLPALIGAVAGAAFAWAAGGLRGRAGTRRQRPGGCGRHP